MKPLFTENPDSSESPAAKHHLTEDGKVRSIGEQPRIPNRATGHSGLFVGHHAWRLRAGDNMIQSCQYGTEDRM
jgi:hypothetical protein